MHAVADCYPPPLVGHCAPSSSVSQCYVNYSPHQMGTTLSRGLWAGYLTFLRPSPLPGEGELPYQFKVQGLNLEP
jgi:hypothetical protein